MAFLTSHTPLSQMKLLSVTLGTALLVGCSNIPGQAGSATFSDSLNELAAESAEVMAGRAGSSNADVADAASPQAAGSPAPEMAAAAPQLVKQADLVIILADLDPAVAAVQQTVERAQGNLLNLQDHRSPAGIARQVSLTLRVPQDRLEPVLQDIRALGTVQQQTITAEDVSSQLVDLEARLKNLRQSEAALLKIMERSGDIADVLEVSRELSNVRESIERMAAQQQNLQRQVAYAHIHLTLTNPASAVTPLRPVGETLSHTWRAASRSVQGFTLNGLKLSLWVLAYSPYLVMAALVALGAYRLGLPRHRTVADGEGEST